MGNTDESVMTVKFVIKRNRKTIPGNLKENKMFSMETNLPYSREEKLMSREGRSAKGEK